MSIQTFIDKLKAEHVRPPSGVKELDQVDHFKCINAKKLDVNPYDYEALLCWFNCLDYMNRHGGSVIFGWAIYQLPNKALLAQHHAVLLSPNREYIDVTPASTNNEMLTFFVDNRAPFDYERMRAPFSFQYGSDLKYAWVYGDLVHDHFSIGVLYPSDNNQVALKTLNLSLDKL